MAQYSSKDVAFVLVGGRSLLGDVLSMPIIKKAHLKDTTPLGEQWKTFADLGTREAQISLAAYFNDAANRSNAALVGLGEAILCTGIEGNTIGKDFIGFKGALQGNYERVFSIDDFHRANASYNANGILEEGKILHVHTAETGTAGVWAVSASVDNGASSANGGSAYLQVSAFALGGYTSFAIKIQQSINNADWTDLVSFTTPTSAPTSERKTVSGTVARYLRAAWLLTGAGAGQSFTFMVGFSRS